MTITDARLELTAACRAAGLRVAPPGAGMMATPCVVITGAEPWLEAAQLGSRRALVSLEAVGLVGGASDPIVFGQLEDMAISLMDALYRLPDWTNPTVHKPGRTEVGGQVYTSVRVTISRIIDTLPGPGAFAAEGFAPAFHITTEV